MTNKLLTEARTQLRWRIPGVVPEKGQDILTRVLGRCVESGDCWEWQGGATKRGKYGRVYVGRRGFAAHRVVYEAIHGPLDPKLFVCHTCDNPPCCNPDHLFAGTAADNNADRHRKGRSVIPDPGTSRGRMNREKTHCLRGHEYTPENTYVRANGGRSCITCRDIRDEGRTRHLPKAVLAARESAAEHAPALAEAVAHV